MRSVGDNGLQAIIEIFNPSHGVEMSQKPVTGNP